MSNHAAFRLDDLSGPVNSRRRVGIDEKAFLRVTEAILDEFYPKTCPDCNLVMTQPVSNRSHTIRCQSCKKQSSRLSYTPLHCLRLPMWMFGWVFYESMVRFPQPLTSAEIRRRLGISYKASLALKRRFQLFCSQQTEPTRILFVERLQERFSGFNLPKGKNIDLAPVYREKPPVQVDTMALFSASQRANNGRKRFRHRGITASIYMNDKLGGQQVGSLFQTITWKGGPVIITSHPDQKARTLIPVLHSYIPYRTPVCSDEGYRFYPNPAHRMVNHSAHARDKRYRWAKDRWSKNGIHNQVAEGTQSAFKTAMRNYRYFRPKYSQMYANEWAFLKNAAFFGVSAIAKAGQEMLSQKQHVLSENGHVLSEKGHVLRQKRQVVFAKKVDSYAAFFKRNFSGLT